MNYLSFSFSSFPLFFFSFSCFFSHYIFLFLSFSRFSNSQFTYLPLFYCQTRKSTRPHIFATRLYYLFFFLFLPLPFSLLLVFSFSFLVFAYFYIRVHRNTVLSQLLPTYSFLFPFAFLLFQLYSYFFPLSLFKLYIVFNF